MNKKKQKTSGEVICEFFKLQPQTIYQDYSCSCLSTAIIFFGRLYIGEMHFCFNSYMFGISKRFSIRIESISKMDLVKNTITGTYMHSRNQQRSFTFSKFVNVNNVYKLMYGLWKGEQIQAKVLTVNQQDDGKDLNEIQLDQSKLESSFFDAASQSADSPQTIAEITFPCTVQQYYDYFLSDKCSLYGIRQHYERKNAQNLQITEWKKNDELQRQVREIRAYIKVEKVPLMSRANLHTIQTLKRQQNGDISLENVTQMADVPYASYFTCQEQISIKSQDDKRCKLQVQAMLVFNKSTYMKKMIRDRTLKDLKSDYELWLKTIQDNLQNIKNRVNRIGSIRRDSIKGVDLDKSMQYEKAQSTTLNFSSILDDDQLKVDKLQPLYLRRLEIKVNILIGLVLVLIFMEFTKIF